ncbi:MAG: hypothetical protein HY717_09880 [Planctomycetes bacterium]|nr:hypothetical protein [Planctomycetota bacterium]
MRCRRRGQRGEIDVADLLAGLLLAVLIPVGMVIILASIGYPLNPSVEPEFAEKPQVASVPITLQDVEEIFRLANTVYEDSALFYLKRWRAEGSSLTRIDWARWAKYSLERSRAGYEEILLHVRKNPGLPADARVLEQRSRQRLEEIQNQLTELKKESPLNL